MVIDIKLLGVPQIKINEEIIEITLKKSEAILYYLLVNKKCSKNEMINLLWGDKNETSAKRNLRVNIHNLKKNFNDCDIISSERDFLFLNPKIEIILDIDSFKSVIVNNIDVYGGDFLEGFYLKGSYEFEEWIYRERLNYKELYIQKLYGVIESDKENNNLDYVEGICKTIIENDLFDEKAYRILMQHYYNNGLFNKSVRLYNSLAEILEKELYLSPSKETQDLFNKIMFSTRYKSKQLMKKESKLFYGREKELFYLNNQLLLYLENERTTPIIIHGEFGIGKSLLIQEFISHLSDKPVFVLQVNCYQEDVELFLKPWSEIALQILDMSEKGHFDIDNYSKNLISHIISGFGSLKRFSYNNAEKEEIFHRNALRDFINLIYKLINEKSIILIFEDIQWMDKESYRILSNLLKEEKNILLICTCRNPRYKSIYNFTALLNKYVDFRFIQLSRFTKEETNGFIELKVEKSRIKMVNCDVVFRESEGNPFFLNHILTNINDNENEIIDLNIIRNVLQFRLLGLSEDARKLLNIISIYNSEVDLKILTRIVNKDELEMFDLIDELEYKDLISETTILGSVFIKITHNKLREFLYNEQPEWKRLILHNKAAECIESNIEEKLYNYNQYFKLIYHYKKSRNIKKELEYSILYLESIIYLEVIIYLDLETNHYGNFFKESTSPILKNEIIELFKRVNGMLKTIKRTDYSEDIIKFEMIYFYILGRFHVINGEYDKCIENINKMLENAEKLNNYEYIIKSYKVMIFYGISIFDISIIRKYVDMGLIMLEDQTLPREKYLFVRYMGVYQLMKGMYNEAFKNLNESLHLIESIKKKQPIDYNELARNYYYLGEVKRKLCAFNESIAYFNKATETCVKNKLGKGLAQYKAKAGQAAFDNGDYKTAKEYFESSIIIYNNYGINWNRSIAEGYLALIYIYENRYTKAIRSMRRADKYCKIYENVYEKGVLYRIKAEIRQLMNRNKKLSDKFSKYIINEFIDYYDLSYDLLTKVENCYEIDTLKKLKLN